MKKGTYKRLPIESPEAVKLWNEGHKVLILDREAGVIIFKITA